MFPNLASKNKTNPMQTKIAKKTQEVTGNKKAIKLSKPKTMTKLSSFTLKQ